MKSSGVVILSLFFVCLPLISVDVTAETPMVRFGATLSLTGSSAPFAKACQRGIELATKDVNVQGGINGVPLEVLIDNFAETDLKLAVSASQKFVSVDKVVALLPNWSEDAEIIAPIAEAHNIVSMALGAGGPGAARFSPIAFRATSSDSELAIASVQYERKSGSNTLCLIEAPTSYYVDIGQDIDREWERTGGKVVLHDTLSYGTTDTRSLATKVRFSKCASLFVWVSPVTITAFSKELLQQKVHVRRVYPWFADTPDVIQLTKGDNNSYILNRWIFPDKIFLKRYEETYHEAFMRPAGNCYDGVRVLASVMSSAGTDGRKVSQALLSLRDYLGVTGRFDILPNRERTGEVGELVEIKDGKLHPIENVN